MCIGFVVNMAPFFIGKQWNDKQLKLNLVFLHVALNGMSLGIFDTPNNWIRASHFDLEYPWPYG